MLPRETEEAETRNVRHPATVSQSPVGVKDRKVDPRVVGPVPGRPDDRADLELASVLETDCAPGGSRHTRLQLDAVAASELARARADQRVPVFQPVPEARLDRLVDQARLRQPPEEVAPGQPLRQRLLTGADREDDAVRGRELLGDLEARVSAPDHEHGPLGHVTRSSVAGAVCLPDVRSEVLGDLGDVRRLEWACRDDDLVGRDRPPVGVEDEAPVLAGELEHVAVELDRELEGFRIAFEIGDHVVACRIAVLLAGEGKLRKAAVAAGREERQRVPALAPRGGDGVGALEDDEAHTLTCEVVAHRQARLTRADDDDLVVGGLRSRFRLACGVAHLLGPSRWLYGETHRKDPAPCWSAAAASSDRPRHRGGSCP